MNPSMQGPPGVYVTPGPDQQPRTAMEVAQEFVAIISADRDLTPDEIEAGQFIMQGMQLVAQQKAAMAAGPEGQAMSDETGDMGSEAGVEDAENSGPAPGAEYLSGGM